MAGFKVGKTVRVTIEVEQDGRNFECVHEFDARDLDETLLSLPQEMFQAKAGVPDPAQIRELVKVWDKTIQSVSGYDSDGDDGVIETVPLIHKVEAVGAAFQDRFKTKKKPMKSRKPHGKH